MKTAISVPDDVFAHAEQVAEQLGWSRSQLYTQAVRDFLAQQGSDPVTEALNALADELNAEALPDLGRELIERGDWEW